MGTSAQLNWQRGREKTLSLWQSEMSLAIIKVAGFWLFHRCIQRLWRSPLRLLFPHFLLLCIYETFTFDQCTAGKRACPESHSKLQLRTDLVCSCRPGCMSKPKIVDVFLVTFLLTMKWEDWYNFQVNTVNMTLELASITLQTTDSLALSES